MNGHEIGESFLPRKFPAIQYYTDPFTAIAVGCGLAVAKGLIGTWCISNVKHACNTCRLIFLQVLTKWSSHYWSIISKMLSEACVPFDSSHSLLEEARMSLATTALSECDTDRALKLFSRVNTPQAAWNQSQVCALCNTSREAFFAYPSSSAQVWSYF